MSAVAPVVRAATAADLPEALRLAAMLADDRGVRPATPPWDERAFAFLATALDDGTAQCFVAEDPDRPGRLVACGVAVVLQVVPSYWLPTGRMGYLQWFLTEEEWRRRGLAAEILRCLLGWCRDVGLDRVQLHTTEEARALYESFGSEETHHPNLWLTLDEAGTGGA